MNSELKELIDGLKKLSSGLKEMKKQYEKANPKIIGGKIYLNVPETTDEKNCSNVPTKDQIPK